MTPKQKLVVVLMDILIFIELTYSIIQGKQDFENMTSIFFMNFIPLFLVTYLVCKYLVKRLEPAPIEPQPQTGCEV